MLRLTLSLRFNGHFPGEPGLAVFSEAKDDGWRQLTTGCAKLQSNHHQQTNTQFFTGRMPFLLRCCPTNSVKALKGKYHIPWNCLPQAHLGVFQLWSLTINSSWLPSGRVAMPIINPLMPGPQINTALCYFEKLSSVTKFKVMKVNCSSFYG